MPCLCQWARHRRTHTKYTATVPHAMPPARQRSITSFSRASRGVSVGNRCTSDGRVGGPNRCPNYPVRSATVLDGEGQPAPDNSELEIMPLAGSPGRHFHDSLIAMLTLQVNGSPLEIAVLILNNYNRDIDLKYEVDASRVAVQQYLSRACRPPERSTMCKHQPAEHARVPTPSTVGMRRVHDRYRRRS